MSNNPEGVAAFEPRTQMEALVLEMHGRETELVDKGYDNIAAYLRQARETNVQDYVANIGDRQKINNVIETMDETLDNSYGNKADLRALDNHYASVREAEEAEAARLARQARKTEARDEDEHKTTIGNRIDSLVEKIRRPGITRREGLIAGAAAFAVGLAITGLPGLKGKGSEASAAGVTKQEAIASRAQAKQDTTVPEAVQDLKSSPNTLKSNIRSIFEKQSAKKLNHYKGSMSNLDPVNNLTTLDYAEAVAYSAKGSSGFRDKLYNQMHGDNENTSLPAGVTQHEADKWIEQQMTAQETTFDMETPNGDFMNHGQHGEFVFDSGVIHLDGSEPVFTMTLRDGTKVFFKEFMTGQGSKRCTNILSKVTTTTITHVVRKPGKPPVTVRIKIPTRPQRPSHPQRPSRPVIPQHPQHPHQPPLRKHGPGDGPHNAGQPPYHADPTQGYPGRGHAEQIDSTQHGDPTNLDPTPNGTQAPNGAPAQGNNPPVAVQPGTSGNPQSTGESTSGTSAGTGTPVQTEGSGETSDPGTGGGGF